MTTEEALSLLRGGRVGVQKWNHARLAQPFLPPSLHGADLQHADLFRADLSRVSLRAAHLFRANLQEVHLESADLRRANLNHADLRGASLSNAELNDADLRGSILLNADLRGADLDGADLANAYLSGAILDRAHLSRANLKNADLRYASLASAVLDDADVTNARFQYTVIDSSLRYVRGLEDVTHEASSSLSISSILNYGKELPEAFLRGCGIEEDEIAHFRSRVGSPLRFYDCFISYSTKDETFATRLHNDFQAAGVRCWKWNNDARTGRSLIDEIDQAIRKYDKLVLIASEASLTSPAVIREIERALQQEDHRAKQKLIDPTVDADVLFPVCIDDYLFKKWDHARKADVVSKMAADACGWDKDNKKYEKLLKQLVRDLKPDAPTSTA